MNIKSIIVAEVANPNTGEVSKKVKLLTTENTEYSFAESVEEFKELTKGKKLPEVSDMIVVRDGQYGKYLTLRKYKVEETLF